MLPIFILDTCVLVSALRSRMGASNSLVKLIGTGRFDIALTTPIRLEYETVLMRSLGCIEQTSDDISDLLDYMCQVGIPAEVRFRVRPSVPDPGDEMVLETAVASGAACIVTHNIRHLADAAKRFGVEVVTPGEALRQLGVSR